VPTLLIDAGDALEKVVAVDAGFRRLGLRTSPPYTGVWAIA
jgi:hypothetical protein